MHNSTKNIGPSPIMQHTQTFTKQMQSYFIREGTSVSAVSVSSSNDIFSLDFRATLMSSLADLRTPKRTSELDSPAYSTSSAIFTALRMRSWSKISCGHIQPIRSKNALFKIHRARVIDGKGADLEGEVYLEFDRNVWRKEHLLFRQVLR